MFDIRQHYDKVIPSIVEESRGLSTGIIALDNHFSGFKGGELTIIGARPGMGKSSLARDIALNIGSPYRKPKTTVLLFSYEMTELEIAELFLVNLAKVDYAKGDLNGFSDSDIKKLYSALEEFIKYNIIIYNDITIYTSNMRELIADHLQQESIGIVIVDYIQRMRYPGVKDMRERVSNITGDLKNIALEFKVPMIGLSQINRSADYSESQRPTLSQLKESGTLEEDADKVLLLYRPSQYDTELDPDAVDTGEAEIIIRKQRKGKIGTVKCAFMAEWMSFCDLPDIKDF